MGVEKVAKVREHADGEEPWEYQRLRGRREKGRGDRGSMAEEVRGGVTESRWTDGSEKLGASRWVSGLEWQ